LRIPVRTADEQRLSQRTGTTSTARLIHRETTLNYACVAGMVKLVMYDDRDGSPTADVMRHG
jgi:dTDP-4-dehydrorhamnose 3,5-epimerase-like enzyme